jgi:peptidylprolyl isomerase
MPEAKNGDTVKVNYTGKLEDGSVFDSSSSGESLEFKIGTGQLIPGFESAVIGMNPGDSKTVRIGPEEAYGPHYEEMIIHVDRKQVPPGMEISLGDQFQLQQESGQNVIVTVTEISEAGVTLDANHPLAGKELIFDIELVAIV